MTISKSEFELEKKRERAIDIALEYGVYDGAFHKQWVIDRMLKTLCTEQEYKELMEQYPNWDHGIPP